MEALSIYPSHLPVKGATGALVLLHGRNKTARSILPLAEELALPGYIGVAPQAPDHSWYPFSSLAPLEMNEPWLSQALQQVDAVVQEQLQVFPAQQVILAGFAQGACLALEYALQAGLPLKAVLAFHGVRITHTLPVAGPTQYHLCCSQDDPLIPAWKVRETHEFLCLHGAKSALRFYRGMHERIPPEELVHIRQRLGVD